MSALDLAALRALATAATPGPYEQWTDHAEVYCGPLAENESGYISGGRGALLAIDEDAALERGYELACRMGLADDEDSDVVNDAAAMQAQADAAYFAALTPDVVLALLDRIEALKAEVEDLAEQAAWVCEQESCGDCGPCRLADEAHGVKS